MEIIKINEKSNYQFNESATVPSAVALGMFDGVHIGHAAVIQRAINAAKEKKIASIVWTLRDAPRKNGIKLCSTKDKIEYIAGTLKPDFIAVEDFSNIYSLSPEQFVQNILVKSLGCKIAVCGYNFRFGHNGAGDSLMLESCMKLFGGWAVTVGEVKANGEAVSSSLIRKKLETGDVANAAIMLGRPFSIAGTVISGRGLGGKIGIPTINLSLPDGLFAPAHGVYITRTYVCGEEYKSVSNIGVRPTVETSTEAKVTLETHIIDCGKDTNLYGCHAEIKFISYRRPETKFPSVDALVKAIRADIEAAGGAGRRGYEDAQTF